MAEKKTAYNKIKKPLPDQVALEAKKNDPPKIRTTYVTAAGGLNVRKGPGKESDVIRVAPYGYSVKVTRTKDNWGFIGDGWVDMTYLA